MRWCYPILIGFGLLLFITFESLQQQFYANNFNNGTPNSLTFVDFFLGALSRWFLWLLSILMLWLILSRTKINVLTTKGIIFHSALLLLFIVLNITLATLLSIVRFNDGIATFSELFTFYLYHKAPIVFVFLIIVMLVF